MSRAPRIQVAEEPHHDMHQFLPRASNIRVTLAREAGIGDHVWTIEELAGILDLRTEKPNGFCSLRPKKSFCTIPASSPASEVDYV